MSRRQRRFPVEGSEVEFRYSPKDKHIRVLETLRRGGTLEVTWAGAMGGGISYRYRSEEHTVCGQIGSTLACAGK